MTARWNLNGHFVELTVPAELNASRAKMFQPTEAAQPLSFNEVRSVRHCGFRASNRRALPCAFDAAAAAAKIRQFRPCWRKPCHH
jgi:hypothetical protein